MTDYDRIEALALLRGVNTSLLHLLATAPIYVLAPIAEAYKSARTAIRILEFRSLGAPKQSEADSVAFRHGDVDAVCGLSRDPCEILEEIAANANKAQQGALAGEFTQPPNCVHESTKSKNLGNVEIVDSAHPMAAEGLRLADEQPCNQPRRSESAWSVTWPCTSMHDASEEARRDLNERYKRAAEAFDRLYPKPDAPQTEYQTLVGN